MDAREFNAMAEKKSFVLRISPELWDALQGAANEDFRSVNGEIEFILTDHLRKRGRLKKDSAPTEANDPIS